MCIHRHVLLASAAIRVDLFNCPCIEVRLWQISPGTLAALKHLRTDFRSSIPRCKQIQWVTSRVLSTACDTRRNYRSLVSMC